MADERPGGPPATPAIGAVPLPPGYVLVERLGSGGFATVWLAEQGRLGRRVAVKLLGETLSDSERERRFIAECRAIGRLSGHPAVVTVHDAGTTDDGHPYLVMEHLPGGSLHDRLHRDGPMAWTDVLDVGIQVADALAAAHDAGILHRDVKPANVLLDENGSPKLGDFGIARLAEGTNTATGTLVGTIPFTPPEVLSGHRPGPTADVWALGATLHTLLVATSPFGGNRDEPPAATIARVLRSEPPTLPPAVPAALRELIEATLRADPQQRPQTATEVVAALQAIQAERGLAVTPARATRATGPTPPVGGTDATVVGLAVATGDPDPGADAEADAATVSRPPEEGATSVLPAHVSSGPDRRGPAPGAPPPPGQYPPPPPRPGSSGRRAGAPLLVGLAVLVALVLVAGVAVALLGGGDGGDDEAEGGSAAEPSASTAGPGDAPAATAIDTPLGAPLAVPAGLAQAPATPAAWDVEVPCAEQGACSIVADDGDVVVVRAPGDGTATVEQRAAATGAVDWELALDGLSGRPGLARLGGLVVVSSTTGGVRTYRGIDEGELRWSIDIPQDDGPVFPNTQLSEDFGVLLLGEVGAYLVVDLAQGTTRRGEGRVLATDRRAVYVADGDRVVARSLAGGNELWTAEGVVSAAPPAGVFPAWRYGVVAGATFVAATATEVVGIDPESGTTVWDAPVPLSADGADLGRPVAVANVGDVVVVAAERGDLGVDAATGAVVWRQARDRLVFDPELDADAIATARGTPVWVGAGDHLLVGWTGARLQLLDVTDGSSLGALDLEPTGGRSAVAIGLDGLAILQAGGTIAAYGYESLDAPLWTSDAHPEAAGLAAVDGGLVVVDPTGLHGLLGA